MPEPDTQRVTDNPPHEEAIPEGQASVIREEMYVERQKAELAEIHQALDQRGHLGRHITTMVRLAPWWVGIVLVIVVAEGVASDKHFALELPVTIALITSTTAVVTGLLYPYIRSLFPRRPSDEDSNRPGSPRPPPRL